jgi:hypothetical protein
METRRLPWGFVGSSVRFAAAGVAFSGVTIASIFAVRNGHPGRWFAQNSNHSFLEQREQTDNLQEEI